MSATGEYTEEQIERDTVEAGKTAPRVPAGSLDSKIIKEQYHVFPGTTVTVCCLTLANGFSVVGHSAAASPDNFDEGIGRRIARSEARNSIWALEGYLLRQRLHEKEQG